MNMNRIPSANRGSLRAKAYDNPVVDRKEKDMKIIVDEIPKCAGDCLFSTNPSVFECRGCSLPGACNAICVLEFNGFCPYLATLPQSTATTK